MGGGVGERSNGFQGTGGRISTVSKGKTIASLMLVG